MFWAETEKFPVKMDQKVINYRMCFANTTGRKQMNALYFLQNTKNKQAKKTFY